MAAPRDLAPAPRRASRPLAPVPALAVTLVACRPAEGDPHRDLPGSSSADPSTGTAVTDTASDSSGPDVLDTGDGPPSYPAPDCATVLLPGPSSDVAATPRPDHDAEVLALSLDPSKVAAPQASYDVITSDLAAIRALDPTLADVHTSCVFPNGLVFWFFDALAVNDALFAGSYHAWDCHNDYFHRLQELRVDGLAVAIELEGVYGDAMVEAYASLPGLDDHEPFWFPAPGGPVSDCTPVAGAITLTATLLPEGALDQRDYRFERADGSSVVYRVTPGEPPQILR